VKRYNHYDQPGTDKAEAVEDAEGEWVRHEDAPLAEVRWLRDQLAEARTENERLAAQWEEHCAYHGAESPHALTEAPPPPQSARASVTIDDGEPPTVEPRV
jgi:hypothetical protein